MSLDWTKRTIYGKLGKVGVATIAGGDIAIADFHRNLHPDICVSDIPVPMERLTPEALKKLGDGVVDAMHVFRDYNPVDLAFFSCTAGSLIGGKGYDARLCQLLKEHSGAPCAYTTTTAVLKALRTLGSKKITICTPYPDDVNTKERDFFAGEGFVVNNINGIVTKDPRNQGLIGKIEPEEIYKFAVEHMHPDSDTMFVSCTGLTMFDIIEDLEKRLGVPVITSNQTAAWLIGCHFGTHGPKAEHLGELFNRKPLD